MKIYILEKNREPITFFRSLVKAKKFIGDLRWIRIMTGVWETSVYRIVELTV